MDPQTRNAAIAAAAIMIGFGFLAFLMPPIMIALGDISPWIAGLFAIGFVGAFFLVFWLRARSQNRKER